jgi:hypothetical protein
MALLVVGIAAWGCGDDTDDHREISFETFAERGAINFLPAVGGTVMLVTLSNQEGLQDFWIAHFGISAPPVDFETGTVVAIVDGVEPNTGYDVSVRRVVQTGGEVVVSVDKRSPGPTCTTGQLLTQPVSIIRVPLRDVTLSVNGRAGPPGTSARRGGAYLRAGETDLPQQIEHVVERRIEERLARRE